MVKNTKALFCKQIWDFLSTYLEKFAFLIGSSCCTFNITWGLTEKKEKRQADITQAGRLIVYRDK